MRCSGLGVVVSPFSSVSNGAGWLVELMKEKGFVPRDQQHSDQCLMARTTERDGNMREAKEGLKDNHAEGNIHADSCEC